MACDACADQVHGRSGNALVWRNCITDVEYANTTLDDNGQEKTIRCVDRDWRSIHAGAHLHARDAWFTRFTRFACD